MTDKQIVDTKYSMILFLKCMIDVLEGLNKARVGKGSPEAISCLYGALECLKRSVREHTISTLDVIEPSKVKININKILKSGGRKQK